MTRILLDARGNHFGGVFTYTHALLRHLPAQDPGIEYVALIDQAQADEGRLFNV